MKEIYAKTHNRFYKIKRFRSFQIATLKVLSCVNIRLLTNYTSEDLACPKGSHLSTQEMN